MSSRAEQADTAFRLVRSAGEVVALLVGGALFWWNQGWIASWADVQLKQIELEKSRYEHRIHHGLELAIDGHVVDGRDGPVVLVAVTAENIGNRPMRLDGAEVVVTGITGFALQSMEDEPAPSCELPNAAHVCQTRLTTPRVHATLPSVEIAQGETVILEQAVYVSDADLYEAEFRARAPTETPTDAGPAPTTADASPLVWYARTFVLRGAEVPDAE